MIVPNATSVFQLNDGERYTWTFFYLFIFLSSLFGDTIILIGSFKEDVFKINIFILTIIQNIAVVNLFISVFDVFPGLISLLANSWILGYDFCRVTTYIMNYIHSVNLIMIMLLTTSKYLLLRFSLQASYFSKKRAHQICSLAWIFSFLYPALMFIFERDGDIFFDNQIFICNYRFKDDIWKSLSFVTATLFLLLPNIVLILTSAPTLKYIIEARKTARRVQGKVRWQGAFTVGLTAMVYTISNFPLFIYTIAENFLKNDILVWFHRDFYRIANSLMLLNIISNVYIYALTMKDFRRFIISGGTSISVEPSS